MKRKDNLKGMYRRVYEKCVLKAQKILPDKNKISQKIKKARKIFAKLQNIPRFKDFATNICDFCDLLSDYCDGTYTNFPVATIISLLAGLLYAILSFDVIADFIPIIGWLDDIGVIAFILKKEQDEMQKYRDWKDNQ